MKIAYRLFLCIQNLKLYRVLFTNLVQKFIRYYVVSSGSISKLSEFYSGTSKQSSSYNVENSLKRVLNLKDRSCILKACLGKWIIGAVVLVFITEEEKSPYPPGWWIFSLLVKKRYRGLGIGENLVRKVLGKSIDRGARTVNLLVNEDNIVAINLYQKIGFSKNYDINMDELAEEESREGKSRLIPMTIWL